jgi:hypothetical protein
MALTCNIDQFGRVVRFITGMILFFVGTLLFMTAIPGSTTGWRSFQVAMILFGIFAMFEGIMGWCALRAMGVKTKF